MKQVSAYKACPLKHGGTFPALAVFLFLMLAFMGIVSGYIWLGHSAINMDTVNFLT